MKMIAYGKYSNPTEYEEGQKKLNWNLKLVRKGNFPAYVVENNHHFFKSEKALDFLLWIFFFLMKITFWKLFSYHVTPT